MRHAFAISRDGVCEEETAVLKGIIETAPLGVTVLLPQASVLPASPRDATVAALPHWALRAAASGAESEGPVAAPPAHQCALALKLVLNAVSTGAHVAKGVVVANVMANM